MPNNFVLVDVFTDRRFAGNQLAVLPDATGLTDVEMQQIAREFNFAETTFVLPANSPGTDPRVRIFTPQAELPFAGHPTLGTAAVLVHLNLVPITSNQTLLRLTEAIGPVAVIVTITPGRPALHSTLCVDSDIVEPEHIPDHLLVAAALGIPPTAVVDCWYASIGPRFCFVHLATITDVNDAVLDKDACAAALAGWAQAIYFYSPQPQLWVYDPDRRGWYDQTPIHARMFAPQLGIDEDPASGSPAAALVAHLANHHPATDVEVILQITQGVKIGRPSSITASATKTHGELQQLSVSGNVVIVGHGTLI